MDASEELKQAQTGDSRLLETLNCLTNHKVFMRESMKEMNVSINSCVVVDFCVVVVAI